MTELVVVARFHYRHTGEYARTLLENAGIPAQLRVDEAVLGMTFSNPASLVVRAEDAEEALEILRDVGILDE